MKILLICFSFVFLSIINVSTTAAETGQCCQINPGPKICGNCAKSQCGAPKGKRGACKACNSTSVFKGEPGFSCSARTAVKMCTWDLIKRDCAKWGQAPAGKVIKKKDKGATTIGGHPVPTDPGGGLCLKWVNKVMASRTLPCNTVFATPQSTSAGTWVKR